MGLVRWLRLSGVVVLMVTLYFVVPVSGDPTRDIVVRALLALVVLVSLAVIMVRQLRLQLDDSARRLDGLVASIVLVVVIFSYAFFALSRHSSNQFVGMHTRLDSLYFAMNNLSTIGTGDVHASGQVARALVLVQMVFNVVFVATTATLLTSRIREKVLARAEERRTQRPVD